MDKLKNDVITVVDEDGSETNFVVEGRFSIDDQRYIVIRNTDETWLMKVGEENGKQLLMAISNPIERERIMDAYEYERAIRAASYERIKERNGKVMQNAETEKNE